MSALDLTPWLPRAARPAPRVEPLAPGHAGTVAAIHGASFAAPWTALDFESLLAEAAVTADGLFFGRSKEPHGFALSRRVLDEAEVLSVAVTPAYRGQGYARPLLRRHLDALAARGVRRVHLEVDEDNAPALALYRRLGFRETGRRAAYYAKSDGTKATALTMTVEL